VSGTRWCFAHAPASAQWRAKGGHNRSNVARAEAALPPRLKQVEGVLSNTLAQVYRGTMEPRQATAVAAVASAIVRVLQAGDLEQRLIALEQAVNGQDASA
jgi:hypothetical protein